MNISKIRTLMALAALAPLSSYAGSASCGSTNSNAAICLQPTATVINTPGGKRKTDEFFMGINWNFATKGAELVLGARSLQTNANNYATGFKIDIVIPLNGTWTVDRIRTAYINGKTHLLGELGFGYSFSQKSGLVMGDIQVPHAVFGLDYLFTGTALPYAGLNTLSKTKAPTTGGSSTTLSCNNGGTLTSVANVGFPVDSGSQINGQTCFTNSNNGS